jgi:hypothetical protein
MARQSLVWTALPNGYTLDGQWLRLSVLLSPRLHPEADPSRLDSFPEWEDWPKALSQAQFAVSCGAGQVTVAGDGSGAKSRLDDRLGLADSATWRALFKPELLVRDHAFDDLSGRQVISYDTVAMTDLIRSLYGELAGRADGELPVMSEFFERRGWIPFLTAVGQLEPLRGRFSVGSGAAPGSLAGTLADFKTFHTPLATPLAQTQTRKDDPRITAAWQEYARLPAPKPADLDGKLDFHQIVSAMGSYPTLLRRLGLVVDMLLDPSRFPVGPNAPLSVQVKFPLGALATPRSADGRPVTRTVLSATEFQAVSDPASTYPLKGRLLDLDPARFALLQVDVDGAGLKVLNFARSLLRRAEPEARVDPVSRQEDRTGAPSLRTPGLMLVQRRRAAWLTDRFAVNQQRNTTLESQLQGAIGEVELRAEDLVRGYRIDVWDASAGAWASLCRRTARYELNDSEVVVELDSEEESTVRLAATTSADPAAGSGPISLHEALATWNGWSLAAPPPGRNIGPDESIDKSTDQSESTPPPGLKFASRFKVVKGSLPRLRFGRKYWLRARAVDLAGNSLDPQPANFGGEEAETRAQPFLRYEPVAAPVIALVSRSGVVVPPGPGESVGRMAIRSYNDAPADNAASSAETAHRALAPPQVSAREAEQHGMLDKAGRVDPATFAMLAHEKDLDGTDPNAVVREVQIKTQGPLDGSAEETTFAVHEVGRGLTYLPDPLASQVAVRVFGHPNIDSDVIIDVPLYTEGAWPEARPFLVELYEHPSQAPHFDAGARALRVPLPKGIRARLRFSMKLDDAALATMGVFAWLDAAGQSTQRDRARDGQHWMLTPWRDLEVVHAVQRPLKTPEIAAISVLQRNLGDTHARPMIVVQCSIDSTDRLDLHAEWHEPTDEGAAPANRPRSDIAFHVKITDEATYATALAGKLAGGVPDHVISSPDLVGVNALADPRVIAKAQEFHDSRYRRIAYRFDATTRFREFLPATLLTRPSASGLVPTDENIKVSGAATVTWIPSSAPPPAPQVLYVLPTFTWTRDRDPAGKAVSGRRSGLRVYLERPWNVSGYGEMLAVVLPSARFSGDPETMPRGAPLKNYVTQWATDPVWETDPRPGIAPRRQDFPLARTAPDPEGHWLPPGAPETEKDQPPGPFRVTALSPAGAPPLALEIAPHDVTWSEERQLWFCDIQLDPGASYFPFVRLALARYQPVSAEGAHLSNVVLADFTALTPGRWVAVASTGTPRSWQVTVSGHAYRASSAWQETARTPGAVTAAKTSVIEVWVEQLDARLGNDFGWRILPAATVTAGALAAAPGDPAEVLWSGKVVVPESVEGAGPCRLVVAEYEEYLVDDDKPYEPPPTRKARRLVYVEHYGLDL